MTDDSPKRSSPQDFTPVPKKHYRHDGWTPERQRAFIAALAECGSVVKAARSIGMSPSPIYRLRNEEGAAEFRAAWDAALASATDRIHHVLVDHAINGAPMPIMYEGAQVGEYRKFNYRMMMWLLRHHKPDQFSMGPDSAPAFSSQRMKALKKTWRAEWEAERREKDAKEGKLVRKRVENKLALMHERFLARRKREAGEVVEGGGGGGGDRDS